MSARILSSRLGEARRARKWSQEQLATRAGVSRAEVSAIENGRQVPSTAAALQLARALACSVEDLFTLDDPVTNDPEWAWTSPSSPDLSVRYWRVRVGARELLIPVEPTALGSLPHDGVLGPGGLRHKPWIDPDRTLVIAGCDPAVGLLAAELFAREGIRLLPLTRGSREALALLERGFVHAAGIHWSDESEPDANAAMVTRTLGRGFRLVHVTEWQEGVALEASIRSRSLRSLRTSRLRWIARERGSGARRVLDRLLGGPERRFRHEARDHRGVAFAIRSGYAQAGVAVKLAAEEAGLGFVSLANEDYELCYRDDLRASAPLAALRKVLKRAALKRLSAELPGLDVTRMGEERVVA